MKKQYINIAAIIGLVFIIGILLGNIIVPHLQEKNFSIEPTTQPQSIVCLEKPIAIKHFTDEGATISSGGRFVDLIEDEIVVTRPQMHNSSGPSVVPTTTEEANTTEEKSESNDDSTTGSEEATTAEETTALQYIVKAQHYAVTPEEIYYTWPIREYTEEQKELIAKMLFCEANTTGWDCQVVTCSAIINHIEFYGGDFGVLDITNHFEPASYYRYRTPSETNWKVLDYVLNGHLVADVKYFQLYNYHDFGTPMLKINGVYFSK